MRPDFACRADVYLRCERGVIRICIARIVVNHCRRSSLSVRIAVIDARISPAVILPEPPKGQKKGSAKA